MSTTIIDYWKSHRSFWITITPEKQKEADEEITRLFSKYNITNENLIGKVIYLDQFSRHFQRTFIISEEDVLTNRLKATELVKSNIDQLHSMDEIEIIFALMPFKHLGDYEFIFEYLHNEWSGPLVLTEMPDLQRFYMDTYKKAFTYETIKKDIIEVKNQNSYSYDPEEILDPDSPRFEDMDASFDWDFDPSEYPVFKNLEDFGNKIGKDKQPVTVSLSGGVDSMVMLYVLKYLGFDVNAVHIIYGNRKVSEQEFNFVAQFCQEIKVKLYVYRIKWLRRDSVSSDFTEVKSRQIDRSFYETMTRQIRFMVYRAIDSNILLGHIKDDVVENIWSNITKCQHLDNLKKMEKIENQMGVNICRPLLDIEKDEIFKLSYKIGIPFLKNTTPSWSNRGKFREHFHTSTVKQYGESIDNKMIEFADAVQEQNRLIYNLLLEPIYNSYRTRGSRNEEGEINVTNAVTSKIDTNMWLIIFEHICHKYLKINRPGNKAVNEFRIRVSKPFKVGDKVSKPFKVGDEVSKPFNEIINVEMTNKLRVSLYKNDKSEYILRFINKF